MSHQFSCANPKLDKTMSPEQFNQIVEAILAGKYSWACVLILRFAGYNPLHYIPYRTYNRLVKENCQNGRAMSPKADNIKARNQATKNDSQSTSDRQRLSKIADLNYLEVMGDKTSVIRGGHREYLLDEKLEEDHSIRWDLAS